jgi:hypothetical protein
MNEERDTDARLWHPWLRINRVLRVMLHTRWSAEAWSEVRVEGLAELGYVGGRNIVLVNRNDRLADEPGEWKVISRPRMSPGASCTSPGALRAPNPTTGVPP